MSSYLDPVVCMLVKKLCVDNNARIVISSSWRSTYDQQAMRAILNAACPALGDLIVDDKDWWCTRSWVHSDDDDNTSDRGREITHCGVLKLFVDMLPDKTSFNARPCAFIGIAAGQFQALRAVEHFQGVAGYRNAYMFPNRVFVGGVHKVIGPDQKLNDLALVERLQAQAKGFVGFITALKKPT